MSEYPLGSVQSKVSFLKGQVLTIIDACCNEAVQRKAVKDLVHIAFDRTMAELNDKWIEEERAEIAHHTAITK